MFRQFTDLGYDLWCYFYLNKARCCTTCTVHLFFSSVSTLPVGCIQAADWVASIPNKSLHAISIWAQGNKRTLEAKPRMLAWSHNSLIRKLLLVTVLSAYLVLYAVNIHKLSCTCPFLRCRAEVLCSRSHCLKAAGFSCGTDPWGDKAGNGRLVLWIFLWEMCDDGFFLLAVVILRLLLFPNVLYTLLFINYFAVLHLHYSLCVCGVWHTLHDCSLFCCPPNFFAQFSLLLSVVGLVSCL